MKNRKNLEAYNRFISDWGRAVYYYKKEKSSFTIFKADVIPSQRLNDQPHVPWVAVNVQSTLIEAAYFAW